MSAEIIDKYGRTWVKVGYDLYSHDRTLACDAEMIENSRLPLASLVATNPNYYRLCDICTSEWTQEERDLLQHTVQEYRDKYGADLWPVR